MTLHNLTLANLNLNDLNAVLDYIQQRNISDWGGSITAASYGSQSANTVLSGPTAAPSANPTFRVLVAADIPSLDASKITTGQLALARGGTHADLSGTGGANQVLKQTSVGGNVSVAALGAGDVPDAALTSNVALLNRTSQTFTGDPQIFNTAVRVHSASAPATALHVGAGTTGTNAEEIRIDSGSGSGGNCYLGLARNGVDKAVIGLNGSLGAFIAGSAANNLAISNGQAIDISTDSGVTLHVSINTSGTVSALGSLVARNGTAIPAGGTAGVGVMVSSTSNFGVFFGSGAPTLSAAKGSLYLRSDGSTTNDRMYVNTNGGSTWTAVITVA